MAPWVTGVKTGHTFGALYVLVGSGQRARASRLISVAIGAPSDEARFDDNLELLEYGFSPVPPPAADPRRPGPGRSVDPLLGRASCRCGRPDARGRPAPRPAAQLSRSGLREEVEGPIRRGARLGRATVLRRRPPGRHRCRCAPARAIPKASAFDRVRAFLADHSVPIALAAFVILIGGILLYAPAVSGKRR